MWPKLSVIMPVYGDSLHRARARSWLALRYALAMPDAELIIARYDGPAWRKGAALSRGAMLANGDIFIIADADVAIETGALRAAVELIDGGMPWVVPHRMVYRLSERATAAVLELNPANIIEFWPDAELVRPAYQGFAGGGIVVISRSAWFQSGGIPHEFVGWGSEDEALALILDTLIGPHARLEAPLFHFYHEPGVRAGGSGNNQARLAKYAAAAGNREAMRRAVAGQDFTPATLVPMVANIEYRRGSEIMKPGQRFLAKAHEATQHAMLRNRYASPVMD